MGHPRRCLGQKKRKLGARQLSTFAMNMLPYAPDDRRRMGAASLVLLATEATRGKLRRRGVVNE